MECVARWSFARRINLAVGRRHRRRRSAARGRSPRQRLSGRRSTRGSPGCSTGSRTCTRRCGSRTPLIGLTVVTRAAVRRGDARRQAAGLRTAPALPEALDARLEPFLVLGEQHHPTQPTRVAAPDMADDSASRPAHRRHDSRRRRHRQDVRVHVSVRRPVARVAGVVIATRRSAASSSR